MVARLLLGGLGWLLGSCLGVLGGYKGVAK